MLKKLSWLLCVCALSVWAQDDEFSEDFSAATETVEETTVDGAAGEGAAWLTFFIVSTVPPVS